MEVSDDLAPMTEAVSKILRLALNLDLEVSVDLASMMEAVDWGFLDDHFSPLFKCLN